MCAREEVKEKSQLELTKYFSNSSSDMSTPMSEISDLTDVLSDKSAMAMPESNSSDQNSATSATSMPESNSSDEGFQGAPPIAKK